VTEIPAGGTLNMNLIIRGFIEGEYENCIWLLEETTQTDFGGVTVKYTGYYPDPLTLDPDTLDFGTLYVNEASEEQNFFIDNNSREDMLVTPSSSSRYHVKPVHSENVTETSAIQTFDRCSCDMLVGLDRGLGLGEQTETVTFTSGDVQVALRLTYTGLNPIVVSTEAMDLGSINEGEELPEGETLTISNPSSEALELTVAPSGSFEVTGLNEGKLNVPAGGSASVTIKPTATTMGTYTGSLRISDPYVAEAVEVSLAFVVNEKVDTLTLDKSSIDFGNVYINAPGAGKTVTLTNNSSKEVTVSSSTDAVYQVGLSNTTIPSKGRVTATITLNADLPLGEGNKTVTFTADGETKTVQISYHGISPLEVTPADLSFGIIEEGSALPAGQAVTVKNLSAGPMAVKFTEPSGYTVDRSRFDASGWLVLEAGTASADVTITPTATAVGAYDGNLTVELASGGDQRTVALAFTVAKVEQGEVTEDIEALPQEPVDEPTMILPDGTTEDLGDVQLEYTETADKDKDGKVKKNTITYNVHLRDEEGNAVALPGECTLIFPYPEGLNKNSPNKFHIIIHHYSTKGTDMYKSENGQIQFLDHGLAITVSDLSPFEISWEEQPGKLSINDSGELVMELVQGYDVTTLSLPTFELANQGQRDISVNCVKTGDWMTISFEDDTILKPGEKMAVAVAPKAGLTPGEYKTNFTFTADTGDVVTRTVVIKVTATPKAPATGDEATPTVWALMLMTGIAVLALNRRKRFS
ncbi:MAG: choice-of-anchor D domain-containing protein, partial [Clostridia bacterium]|nr:choice-of-anchor D domain-containing protein [Clostridia bacterium]